MKNQSFLKGDINQNVESFYALLDKINSNFFPLIHFKESEMVH